MKEAGIHVVVTPVGDRNVLSALEEHDLVLGGEQSGHLIYRAHATTGDGLLAAMFLADSVVRRGHSLDHAARSVMTRFPQVLLNVRTNIKVDNPAQQLEHAIAVATATLGDDGRVLVRASGTEPLVRIMVEAATEDSAYDVARTMADALIAMCGGEIEGGH
jgi:phosphoglucosamine mutase